MGVLSNGLALALVAIFYWPPGFVNLHPEGKTPMQQFKELDFVGLLLFGGGLTSFLIGVSWGNNPYPWSSVQVLVPLLTGGGSTSSFTRYLYLTIPRSCFYGCVSIVGNFQLRQNIETVSARNIREL